MHSLAPEIGHGVGRAGHEAGAEPLAFVRPPSPLEVLENAFDMVVSEGVVGSCTAIVVTLDARLNQLA